MPTRNRSALRDNPDSSGDDHSDDEHVHPTRHRTATRNAIAFWLLGLCNNFAYVIMLSAAKDILESEGGGGKGNDTEIMCQEPLIHRVCSPMSTGAVLLADIIPALLIKLTAPLFLHSLPFGLRHLLAVVLQAFSYVLVASGSGLVVALTGVSLASAASGLGEVTYLSLASHFHIGVVSAWSSGTGGAGVIGALAYAALTDHRLLALSPSTALLSMLVIPVLFAYTYWSILSIPSSLPRVRILSPFTYIIREDPESASRPLLDDVDDSPRESSASFNARPLRVKLRVAMPLLRYMLPLTLVYFGEYFINQGLFEVMEFSCSRGFDMSPSSQYRWYQVLYQVGVFISRSSAAWLPLPAAVLPLLAGMQLLNAALLFFHSLSPYIPHITLAFLWILFEGLLGGSSYVNTFRTIHKQVSPSSREFCLGFASMGDTLGVMAAGFASIPAHNYICRRV